MPEMGLELVKIIAEAAEEKKANDVMVLDIRDITTIADYFVICSGHNNLQTKAIIENVMDKLEEKNIYPINREGMEATKWVVLDYADVMVHIFAQEQREFYELERLWKDAKVVELGDLELAD